MGATVLQKEACASGKRLAPYAPASVAPGEEPTFCLWGFNSHVYTSAQGCGHASREPHFLNMQGRMACLRGTASPTESPLSSLCLWPFGDADLPSWLAGLPYRLFSVCCVPSLCLILYLSPMSHSFSEEAYLLPSRIEHLEYFCRTTWLAPTNNTSPSSRTMGASLSERE